MRPDQRVVASLVPPSACVLDLGCGDGALLEALGRDRGCRGTGVELDRDAFLAAVARGVPVLSLDVDTELRTFDDDSYDVVVLSQTLQAVRSPAGVLAEVRRIAPRAVLSTPNAGWWRHRAALLRGRMPVPAGPDDRWFATPDIRLSTLADLEDLLRSSGWRVVRRVLLRADGRPLRTSPAGNLLAPAAAYLVERTP